MLSIATIVFRECLEIALVLTIVLAATRGLKGRAPLVLGGLGLGIAGAALIAVFTDVISEAVDGMGQEVFNAAIMFIAVGFLSWTVVWMRRYGREVAQELKQVGQEVVSGKRPSAVILFVIAVATLREGAEIVLFTYGMVASGAFTTGSIVLGGVLGTVGGVAIGTMIYFGLLKAAQKHLFTVTSWMLMLLTAGMAAQGAGFLIAADVLPSLIPMVWDSSALLSGGSFMGETMGVLVGYTPRPSGMELLFYFATLAAVVGLYQWAGRARRIPPVSAVA